MSRRPYIALVQRPGQSCASRTAEIASRLASEGWNLATSDEGMEVWVHGAAPHAVKRLAGGWGLILGDLFPTCGSCSGPMLESQAWRDPGDAARQITRNLWGGYIAFLRRPGGPAYIYRDPGGSVGCVTWSIGDGLDVVALELTCAPGWLQPRRLSLDWNRIAAVTTVPTTVTTDPLFDDMTAVAPGAILALDGASKPLPVWTPATFAAAPISDLRGAQTELVRRVDQAVAALLGRHQSVVAELSGGLDSSVLAGSVDAVGMTGRISRWLNYRDPRAEADESDFARAVTDRLGVELHVEPKNLVALDIAALQELGPFSHPAIGGVDAVRDRFEAGLLATTGATGILSGQGGDGVFFQFPSPMVVADEFNRRGAAAWTSPVLADIARRKRQNVWSVLREVRLAKRGREERPLVASTLVRRELQVAARNIEHEWVKEARAHGLPPGKVLHVQGIALTHFYYQPSRRLAVADILMPLFTQPVMELCLSIPVPDLSGRNYDRPFERETFAERLPTKVLNRRSKGNVSAYVSRLVAASCETLRPFLIDGCLAEAGLLDRSALEHNLNPENLMIGQDTNAGHVLNATAVEAWVRYWQGRVPDSPTAGRW